jgi:hypothetical protein
MGRMNIDLFTNAQCPIPNEVDKIPVNIVINLVANVIE